MICWRCGKRIATDCDAYASIQMPDRSGELCTGCMAELQRWLLELWLATA